MYPKKNRSKSLNFKLCDGPKCNHALEWHTVLLRGEKLILKKTIDHVILSSLLLTTLWPCVHKETENEDQAQDQID